MAEKSLIKFIWMNTQDRYYLPFAKIMIPVTLISLILLISFIIYERYFNHKAKKRSRAKFKVFSVWILSTILVFAAVSSCNAIPVSNPFGRLTSLDCGHRILSSNYYYHRDLKLLPQENRYDHEKEVRNANRPKKHQKEVNRVRYHRYLTAARKAKSDRRQLSRKFVFPKKPSVIYNVNEYGMILIIACVFGGLLGLVILSLAGF